MVSRADLARARRKRLRAAGICARCGKGRAAPGSACLACCERSLAYYRAKRAVGYSRAKGGS